MKTGTALAGGLAGAVALNLIHETYRKIDKDAPHIHLIGEEALVKLLKAVNLSVPHNEKELYGYTLAGDILSNALYYSCIGFGRKKHLVRRGLIAGLAAGIWCCFFAIKNELKSGAQRSYYRNKSINHFMVHFRWIGSGRSNECFAEKISSKALILLLQQ